jgi:biotin-dependent carboxylase-like uncharacterized protein
VTNQLQVVRAGALSTVQDLGRPGFAHLAVTAGGAADVPALRLANRLVGNEEGAAALETTMDGIAVRLEESRWVAVTGAPATVRVAGSPADWGLPVWVTAGQLVEVGVALSGVRSYLAVAGGLDLPLTMGSRSTNVLTGIGPAPLRIGDRLPLGDRRPSAPTLDAAPVRLPGSQLVLDCYLGPRDDAITRESIAALARASWTVSALSNRVGLRLEGPALAWRSSDELPSEGVVLGSVQVPADGQPVLFLADHPATGGYPVVGVVPERDVWRCGQARAGSTISFRLKRLNLTLPPG